MVLVLGEGVFPRLKTINHIIKYIHVTGRQDQLIQVLLWDKIMYIQHTVHATGIRAFFSNFYGRLETNIVPVVVPSKIPVLI